MSFNSGDKLVCVKPGEPSLGLIKDKVYTCLDFFVSSMGENVVEVLETMPPSPYHGYQASRFRLALPSDLKKVKEQLETVL